MRRPPRNPNARIFDKRTIVFALTQGLVVLLVTLMAYLVSLYRGQGEMDARAISFTTLVLGNLALIWANRSRTRTIPEMLRTPNGPLWMVTLGTLALLAVVLYVPVIRELFEFSTLHPDDLLVSAVLAALSIGWLESIKLWHKREVRLANRV